MARLGDICKFQSGGTPSKSNPDFFGGNIPWITTVALNGGTIGNEDAVEWITDIAIQKSAAKVVPQNSILVGTRVGIGKVAINSVPMSTSQDVIAMLDIDTAIWNKNFLCKFIQSKNDFLLSQARGATIKGIKIETLSNMQVPDIPINEQCRIATVMDKVGALIAKRQAQLDELDLLVKARFVEMFGDSYVNPYKLPMARWNDVFYTTTGKLDSNAAVDNGEYPFFTCSKETLRIDKYAFDQEALLLAGNNAAGKYDVKHYKGKFNAYQRTYVLSLKHDWSYALFQFQLEDKLGYLEQQSLGGLTKYLTLKILNELEFIIPEKSEQDKFAVLVEQIEKLKLTILHSFEKLETLKKALMQQYFG